MTTQSNFQPRPWVWICHKCRRRYPLACTRRCLECGHNICYSERDTVQHHCNVQFDFRGWQRVYNQRRSRLLQQSSLNEEMQAIVADVQDPRQQERERLEQMLSGTSSCFTDCRLPSECFITMALREMAMPTNQPSSSSSEPASERRLKTPTKAKKYKRRRRRNFQRMPSPLIQEWRIGDILDEEVDDDAVLQEGGKSMKLVEGREEEMREEVVKTGEDGEQERGEFQFAIR